jgi:pimeloyl-ACP methyl ester carboxylesterase
LNDVWVIIPEVFMDMPLFGAFKLIESAKDELIQSGFNPDGSIFLAGHSLGGVAVQDYAVKYPGFANGLILFGATMLRKYDLKIPVMSINGELDGQVLIIDSLIIV